MSEVNSDAPLIALINGPSTRKQKKTSGKWRNCSGRRIPSRRKLVTPADVAKMAVTSPEREVDVFLFFFENEFDF